MLDPAAFWIIGITLVVLPFVLSYTMNGRDQADPRGRRMRTQWVARSLRRR